MCKSRIRYNSVHTIHDNSERIKESAKSEAKVFVWQGYHPIGNNCNKNHSCYSLILLLHYK